MWSFLVGVATPDVVKDAANTATNAVTYAAQTVKDGTTHVVAGATQAANSAVKMLSKPSQAMAIKEKNEARKLNTTAEELRRNPPTPEQLWKADQLNKFKKQIRACNEVLRDEVKELSSLCFAPVFRRKIDVKKTKKRSLENLLGAPDWDSFASQARTLLEHGGEVIAGHHSRTREILIEIVSAKFNKAEAEEIVYLDKPPSPSMK